MGFSIGQPREWQLVSIMMGKQESNRRRAKQKPEPLCNLISEVTHHLICHILFVQSKSLGPLRTLGWSREGVLHEYQEEGIPRSYLRSCSPQPRKCSQRILKTKGWVASGLYLALAKPWSERLSAAFIRIQAEFNIMQSAVCQLPAWPMKQCKFLCAEVNHLHQNPVLFRTKFASKISEK